MNRLAVPGPLHKMNGDITNAFPWFHVIVTQAPIAVLTHSAQSESADSGRPVKNRLSPIF